MLLKSDADSTNSSRTVSPFQKFPLLVIAFFFSSLVSRRDLHHQQYRLCSRGTMKENKKKICMKDSKTWLGATWCFWIRSFDSNVLFDPRKICLFCATIVVDCAAKYSNWYHESVYMHARLKFLVILRNHRHRLPRQIFVQTRHNGAGCKFRPRLSVPGIAQCVRDVYAYLWLHVNVWKFRYRLSVPGIAHEYGMSMRIIRMWMYIKSAIGFLCLG